VRAPATRDQADAYRFGLRRLEAALVRGDPVPLHEQIRTQRRAALGGVALGLLGLCAAALYAVIAPSPNWQDHALISSSDSGQLYVVTPGDPRLMPVDNLPAARLVLAALGRGDALGVEALEVPDTELAFAPRTAAAAVPGADGAHPEETVEPNWALCDLSTPDGASAGTMVIGGAAATPPAAPGDAVLLAAADDTTWLVVDGVRHRVDVGDGALLAAFGLSRVVPRQAGTALLELLPEGPELATPVVRNRGADAPDGLPGQVGDVLVSRPVGGGEEYYVVLSRGLQRVPEVVAELLRVASGEREPRLVGTGVLADATFRDDLDVSGWPQAAPRLLDPARTPAVCWTWTPVDDPAGRVWMGGELPLPPGTTPVQLEQADGSGPAVDSVAVGLGGAVRAVGGSALPTPDPEVAGVDEADDSSDVEPTGGSESGRDAQDPEDEPTTDDDVDRGDRPANGADREDEGSAGPADRDSADADRPTDDPAEPRPGLLDAGLDGQLWLVSETGVGFPVADDATATALSVSRAEPAPAALLVLLPTGPPLDLSAVVDVLR
jgi:type VII secretion protein EccB